MVQLKHIFLIVANIVSCLISYFCLTLCLKKSFQQNCFNKNMDNISDHVHVQLAINYTDLMASSNIVNEQYN